MGSIPPISPYSMQPSSNDLANELWQFVSELRELIGEYEKDPSSPALLAKIETCMKGMESFLEKNKAQLFQIMKNQGWSATGMNGFENYYDAALSSIQLFLQKPNMASLDMVNEQATQIHWLMTHNKSASSLD